MADDDAAQTLPPEEAVAQEIPVAPVKENPAQETPATETLSEAAPAETSPIESASEAPTTTTEAEAPDEPETSALQPTTRLQSSAPNPPASIVNDLLIKARAAIQIKKQKKLDRIMEIVAAEGSIANDRVEKNLHVGDTIATRYLDQLVKEGRLERVGETGKAVRYEKL